MRWTMMAASVGIVFCANAFAQQPGKPMSQPEQQKRFPDSVFDEKRKGDDSGQKRFPDSVFDEKRTGSDAKRQAPDARYDRERKTRELDRGRQIRDRDKGPERKMRDR